ncbi:MAG: AI-2E family transporter [Acidobacteriota bacterium]
MTEHPLALSKGLKFLLGAASFVAIVAGMKAAAPLLVPFLVAVFLAVIAAPMVFWLRRQGVPATIAVSVVIIMMIGFLTLVGYFVGSSINGFVSSLPAYEEGLKVKVLDLANWLGEHGIGLSQKTLTDSFDPGAAMGMAAKLITSIGGLITNALLILLTVIFILLEASSFPAKIRSGLENAEVTLEGFREFAITLNRYVAIKTMVSLATGASVAFWNAAIGIDYPLLWGLLAFLLNYIPNLGSILAAVPAILLALLQYGWVTALILGIGYLVINLVISNLLEPRFLGRGLGLSTLIVFVSLVSWAWVLGPVGMLLSVPLTVTLKIALASSPRTRWIAALLGPPIPEPVGPTDIQSEEFEIGRPTES